MTAPANGVRVLVAEADGSTPREAGAAMTVFADRIEGTIGGGALEHQAIAAARAMLDAADVAAAGDGRFARSLETVALGPERGQCCGGRVRLLYEALDAAACAAPSAARLLVRPCRSGPAPLALADRRAAEAAALPRPVAQAAAAMLSGAAPMVPRLMRRMPDGADWLLEPLLSPARPLFLYGAGHVGRALVRVLEGLPFDLHWVDTAPERFPQAVARHATAHALADPSALAAAAPAGALHLVMTYSHALDLAICARLFAAGRFGRLGLIGSATKRRRFERRLAALGVAPEALARLECPIGVPGVAGKAPAVIAVATAAQALQWLAADAAGAASEQASERASERASAKASESAA